MRGPQVGFFKSRPLALSRQNHLGRPYPHPGFLFDHRLARMPVSMRLLLQQFFCPSAECPTGPYIRHRSVEHVIAELRAAHQRYSLKFVAFHDDVFTCDRRWLKSFLIAYRREINIPFQCIAHPQFVDEEVARWLYEAGCHFVQLGVQSLADEYKQKIIKRQGSRSEVERALESLNKNRIRVKVDHILALPGEPPVAQETAREVSVRARGFVCKPSGFIFSGTELLATAKEQGLLSATDVEIIEDGQCGGCFHGNSRIVDKELLKTYKTYEVIFKLIPILRQSIKKLNPQILRHFPLGLCSAITFILDALHGLIGRNPDHLMYSPGII